MQCPNPTCKKEIADAAAFCPYCGHRIAALSRKIDDTPAQAHKGIRFGALLAAVAGMVVVLLLLAALVRCGSGAATASQSSLPEPFEGTISLDLNGMLQLHFSVDEGQSTLSLESPQAGEVIEASAGLDLVDTELGSGVYDYVLEGLAANGISASSLEEETAEYFEFMDGSHVQVVIPFGATDGAVAGTWAVRDETGKAAVAFSPIIPKGIELTFFEIKVTFDEDGSFDITRTVTLLESVDGSEEVEHEIVEVLTGSWHAEGSHDAVMQVEGYRATADGVVDMDSQENFNNGYTWIVARTMSVDLDVTGDQADAAPDAASQVDGGVLGHADETEGQAPVDVPVDQAAPEEVTREQGVSAETGAVDAESAFVARAREGLFVPDRPEITYEIAEPQLWEGTGTWMTPIAFFENGELVASADCTDDGTPVKNMMAYTGDRS